MKRKLRFIIPSFIGVFLFITPIVVDGEMTIPIAILVKLVSEFIRPIVPILALIFVGFSVFGGLFNIDKYLKNSYLKTLLHPSMAWRVVRGMGLVFLIMIVFKLGGEYFCGTNTGGLILNTLFPVLFAVFLVAGLLLPLLLNFGLLEFTGTLLTKVMRPLFLLPGRSSINCIASWLGDGTIGILLTNKQYVGGYYTQREAAVIGTTFSAVSITFCLVVIETVGLGNMFLPFYLTVSGAGVVAALIMPRIPPLSRKKDLYYNNTPANVSELIPNGETPFSWGVKLAQERADSNKKISSFFVDGLKNVLDMWVGVLPVVLAVGTVALMLAEYTPLLQYLGVPFYPMLEFMGVPEAKAASETMMVGFADMFIPSILAAGTITSPMTRFIVAALSVTQLIYMAEVGGLLLGSKIPISFTNLIAIFIERTIITLPIIVLVAKFLF
ncbi:MAG: YjiH family protein [Rikenellaceae bacterium]